MRAANERDHASRRPVVRGRPSDGRHIRAVRCGPQRLFYLEQLNAITANFNLVVSSSEKNQSMNRVVANEVARAIPAIAGIALDFPRDEALGIFSLVVDISFGNLRAAEPKFADFPGLRRLSRIGQRHRS